MDEPAKTPKAQLATYSQFACIGSGFSGIGLGATLRRWYGITDLRIFERHSELGGTWFVNQYPGCACDVPSILYSFSFAPNPNWTKPLPSREELWMYLRDVANQYDLIPKITFGANVEKCTWITESRRWRMIIRDTANGNYYTHECQFLFAGCGILVEPRIADIPGIDTFAGSVISAARWRHDIDLQDKNVAVLGNGCTGNQIVPAIYEKTKHLTHFFRSKHWIVPPIWVPNTATLRWLFRYIPFTMLIARLYVYFIAEMAFKGVPLTKRGAAWRRRQESRAKKYIRETAPKKYHDMLIPDFEIGCKRRIFDSEGYLKCLNAKNVTLTDDRVEAVVPDGLQTANGFVPADVIVLATGYSTNKYLPGIEVTGPSGELHEHWDRQGGPSAYNCTAVSGFPNFFILLGPNATTGHTSTILAIENGVNFALRMIKPVLDGEALDMDLKPQAEQEYANNIQQDLKETVFATGCGNWYARTGEQKETWNAMTYPWSQAYLWYRSLFPTYKDWTYTPAPGAWKKVLRRYSVRLTKYAALLAVLAWVLKSKSRASLQ